MVQVTALRALLLAACVCSPSLGLVVRVNRHEVRMEPFRDRHPAALPEGEGSDQYEAWPEEYSEIERQLPVLLTTLGTGLGGALLPLLVQGLGGLLRPALGQLAGGAFNPATFAAAIGNRDSFNSTGKPVATALTNRDSFNSADNKTNATKPAGTTEATAPAPDAPAPAPVNDPIPHATAAPALTAHVPAPTAHAPAAPTFTPQKNSTAVYAYVTYIPGIGNCIVLARPGYSTHHKPSHYDHGYHQYSHKPRGRNATVQDKEEVEEDGEEQGEEKPNFKFLFPFPSHDKDEYHHVTVLPVPVAVPIHHSPTLHLLHPHEHQHPHPNDHQHPYPHEHQHPHPLELQHPHPHGHQHPHPLELQHPHPHGHQHPHPHLHTLPHPFLHHFPQHHLEPINPHHDFNTSTNDHITHEEDLHQVDEK